MLVINCIKRSADRPQINRGQNKSEGTLLTPAWATGDAGHLEKFPVLPGIEALTVLVDHDENGRGQRATAECARRWTAAGREVTQLIPRITGEDFADLVGEPS